MADYENAEHVVRKTAPADPVFCNRPHLVRAAAQRFLEGFPGPTFYAIKANPAPWLLQTLYESGVTRFEVASIAEVREISELLPAATIAFMHPVKSWEAIEEAYRDHGVRIFALDCQSELDKILGATNNAKDLTLCLRHAVPNDDAKISLGRKFGTSGQEAIDLLQIMRQSAQRLGVAFHVGSQTMSPAAYVNAVEIVEQTIIHAGVIVDVLDIGGGFPACYPGMEAPPLTEYFDAISRRFDSLLVAENCELWAEPGRALCADASSLIIRVEARKNDHLYVNEGVYGALFDAGHLNWPFPARQIGANSPFEINAFSLYGPTCDDLDYMPGPFYLPADIGIGDYIEIGMIGAYGASMRTGFNGFQTTIQVEVMDGPMANDTALQSQMMDVSKEWSNG